MSNAHTEVTQDTSDGYHTFGELYEYRMLYNALLFNEWARQGRYDVHKSARHSDGEECFGGGWFVVVAQLPTGQISNHYKMKYWDLFQVPERERGATWDGRTPRDVADRLAAQAARTEPASGDDMPTILRKAAGHMEGTRGCQYPTIWAEADRLEAAQAQRDEDIRIGRALHEVRNAVCWGKSYTDEWFADYGRTAREAVENGATS